MQGYRSRSFIHGWQLKDSQIISKRLKLRLKERRVAQAEFNEVSIELKSEEGGKRGAEFYFERVGVILGLDRLGQFEGSRTKIYVLFSVRKKNQSQQRRKHGPFQVVSMIALF